MALRPLITAVSALLTAAFAVVALAQTPPQTAPASPPPAVAAAQGVPAAPLQVTDDAPSRYTVKRGDTLWSIAGRFLKSPWRWPEIWRMNRDQISNPHRLRTGDVLVLSRGTDGQPQLTLEKGAEPERPTIRLTPQMRVTPIDNESIPSIPPAVIDPFLTKPLVIERDGLETAPKIVGTVDTRVVLAEGYKVYAVGVDETKGTRWHIYRPGKALSSPGKKEPLGYEAEYLGDAVVDKFGDVTTLTIVAANQEIVVGDKLIQVERGRIISYPPHAPDRAIDGTVISMPRSLVESGRDTVVALDVGARDGLEIGHVLAVHHTAGTVDVWDQKNPYTYQTDKRTLKLPDERVGLVFVFRVFDRVSYALVLNSTRQVEIGDWVRKP